MLEERIAAPADEVMERAVKRCRTDQAIACWADRRNIEIAHFYHRESRQLFVLHLGSRNFSPHPARYDPQVEVKNGDYEPVGETVLDIVPSFTVIDGTATMESIGQMQPYGGTVITRVTLTSASSPSRERSPLPGQIEFESVIDPDSYTCPCCSA